MRKTNKFGSRIPFSVLLTGLVWVAGGAQSANLQGQEEAGVQSAAQKRSNEAAQAKAKPKAKADIKNDMPEIKTSLAGLRIAVSGFKVEGNIKISEEGMKSALAPWADRDLTFPEFEKAVHAAAQYLRENGHPGVKVRISRASMKEGKFAIALEGLTPQATDYAEVKPVKPVLLVKRFKYSGVTVATNAELDAAVAKWTNRELTAQELQEPAQAVASLLRSKGYPLAQAFLPPQKLDGGELEIRAQEGVVDGNSGYNGVTVATPGNLIKPEVVAKTIATGVTPGQPLKVADLEQSLLVANELPGVKVSANLAPGSAPGTTQVLATVEDQNKYNGSFWLDNYGSRYTGETRANLVANFNSPTGYGDLITAQLTESSNLHSAKVSWQFPVGPKGAKLGLSYSSMRSSLTQLIVPLNVDGKAEVASVFGSYPLKRSATSNIWATASFDDKRMSNNLVTLKDIRDVQLGTVGLSGDWIDAYKGHTQWTVNLGSGTAHVGGDLVAASANSEGNFTKLNWALSRTAPLSLGNGKWSLLTSASGQSNRNYLDNSEKFQLGGPGGVRAYPVGEAFGDSGYLATVELRYSLGESQLGDGQLFSFVDTGGITSHQATGVGTWTTTKYTLSGGGLGLSFTQGKKSAVKLMVAKKFGSNPNPTSTGTDNDGTNKNARVWILGTVNF
ncbi:MAG: hypothetical protein RLZZ271_749 [Pseudomonadota bacterium]|jgi:hemolysin activation/secretion protein